MACYRMKFTFIPVKWSLLFAHTWPYQMVSSESSETFTTHIRAAWLSSFLTSSSIIGSSSTKQLSSSGSALSIASKNHLFTKPSSPETKLSWWLGNSIQGIIISASISYTCYHNMHVTYNSVLKPLCHYLNVVHSVQWEYVLLTKLTCTHHIYYGTIGIGRIVVYVVYVYAGFVNRTLSHYVNLQFRAISGTNLCPTHWIHQFSWRSVLIILCCPIPNTESRLCNEINFSSILSNIWSLMFI